MRMGLENGIKKRNTVQNIRKYFWDKKRQKFIPHIYLNELHFHLISMNTRYIPTVVPPWLLKQGYIRIKR